MSRMIYTRVSKKCACILFAKYKIIDSAVRVCQIFLSRFIFSANFRNLCGETIISFQSPYLLNRDGHGQLFVSQSNFRRSQINCSLNKPHIHHVGTFMLLSTRYTHNLWLLAKNQLSNRIKQNKDHLKLCWKTVNTV